MSQKYALIIGTNEYQDANLAKLTAPIEDVNGLVRVLKDPKIGDFDEVIQLKNETVSTTQRAIAKFFAKRKRDDLLLLYVSGHSILNDQGNLYLAFKDTEYDLLSGTSIPTNFIAHEMDRCHSQRQVLILDCCHSGAATAGAKSALGTRVGIANAFEGKGYGRVIMTASDSTQLAWEGSAFVGEGGNSLFTHYLIEGLETGQADINQDGNVSLDELYDYIYERVLQETPKQTPGKWSFRQNGEIVLAKNPLPNLAPQQLAPELIQAIESPIAAVREAIIPELEKLLHGSNKGMSLAALDYLNRLSKDDSKKVSRAAQRSVDSYKGQQKQVSKSPVDLLLEKANLLFKEKKLAEAISAYQEVLELDPNNQYALYALDALHATSKKQTNVTINNLIKEGNDDLTHGRYQDAVINYKAALQLDPDNEDILGYIQKGRQLLEEEEKVKRILLTVRDLIDNQSYEDAQRNLRQASNILPDYPPTLALQEELKPLLLEVERRKELLKQANALRNEKQFDAAIQLYEEILSAAPDHQAALSELSFTQQQQLKFRLTSLIIQGQKALDQGKIKEAWRYFKEALSLDPQSSEASTGVAECEALLKEENEIQSLLNSGKQLLEEEKYQEALAKYRKVIVKDPIHTEANEYVASIQKRIVQLELVDKLIAEAESFHTKKKYEQAQKIYERILQMDPTNDLAKKGLTKVQKALGILQTQSFTTASPKKSTNVSKRNLVIAGVGFLFLSSIGFWMYQQSGESASADTATVNMATPAQTAKEEMLARKAEAEKINAQILAVASYSKAKKAEERGDQESKNGDHMMAKLSYNSARNLYNQAIQEATGQSSLTKAEGEEDLEAPVLVLKQEMLDEQSEAGKVDAQNTASGTYKRAFEAAQQGDRAMEAEDYETAEQAYETAKELFKQSREEVKRKEIVSAGDLNRVKQLVEEAKAEMTEAKTEAQTMGAESIASELFEHALNQEAEGDRLFLIGDQANYISAQEAYSKAKSRYNLAKRSAEASTRYKEQATTAKSQMVQAKAQVEGSTSEQKAHPTYQTAMKLEAAGNQQFEQGEFETAKNSYRQATNLFQQSSGEIALLLAEKVKETQAAKEAELKKENKLKAETEAQTAAKIEAQARDDIQALIRQYKQGLENSDIPQMASVNPVANKKMWSPFFKRVKDMEVYISGTVIDLDNVLAQASFDVNMTYFNKTTKKTESRTVKEVWSLKKVGDDWKVINP